jgi:hypothetical protein
MPKPYHKYYQTDQGVKVKSFTQNGYPPHSVLAGQTLIQYEGTYPTLEEALEKYPDATPGHPMIDERNYFDHLPDGPDLY